MYSFYRNMSDMYVVLYLYINVSDAYKRAYAYYEQ